MLNKRKLLGFLAAGFLYATLCTFNIYAANTGVTTDSGVNIRQGASLDAEIITKLSSGKPVDIISAEGDWYKFKYDNSEAYISRQYVKLLEADGVVVEDAVNIRAEANTDSEIIDRVSGGMVLTAQGIAGDFYIITYNDRQAYIHKDFLLGDLIKDLAQNPEVSTMASKSQAEMPVQQEVTYVLITSETGLKLRQGPSKDSEKLALIPSAFAVDLIEAGTEWHQVSYNGKVGYVSAEFTEIKTGIMPDNTKGQQIVEYAKQFLGTPYVWSGTNLRSGVDCSGFVYAVMRDNGISVSRSSIEQIKNGVNISKDQLKAGDLVFFDTTNATNQGYISHVGIYMSNGQFIHSSSSRKSYCVTISSLYEDYYVMRYVGATRVIN